MTWRRHLLDFSEASVASFAATVSDGALYMLLLWTLVDRDIISVGVAAALGGLLGGIIHYSLSRFWVFERFHAPIVQSALTYFPMSWLAAVLHGLATEGLTRWFDPKLAWFFSKGVVWILWTYPMSRFVVFGGIGSGEQGDEDDDSDDSSCPNDGQTS